MLVFSSNSHVPEKSIGADARDFAAGAAFEARAEGSGVAAAAEAAVGLDGSDALAAGAAARTQMQKRTAADRETAVFTPAPPETPEKAAASGTARCKNP